MNTEAVAGISFVVAVVAVTAAILSYMTANNEIRRIEMRAVVHGWAKHEINEYGDIELKWSTLYTHNSGEHE